MSHLLMHAQKRVHPLAHKHPQTRMHARTHRTPHSHTSAQPQNNGRPAHQEIGHVHFHIIPKTDDGRGLGTSGNFWKSRPIDKAEAPVLAAKIAALIKQEDDGAEDAGGAARTSTGSVEAGSVPAAAAAASTEVTPPAEGQ